MADKKRNPLICFRVSPAQNSCRTRTVAMSKKWGRSNAYQIPSKDRRSKAVKMNDGVNLLPETRHEKVARIRKEIREGTYPVDPAKIAEKMLQKEM